MNYIYPKLSDKDLGFVRLGGAGLGNILFTYARAAVFARDHDCRLIWPTWFSFKLGPVLRREKDKRFYRDLFQNNEGAIGGFRKLWLLATKKHIPEKEKLHVEKYNNCVIEFTGFDGCFEEILYESAYVRELLIRNLKKKNRAPLDRDFNGSIGVHVRLGDFGRVTEQEVKNGRHDSALPIRWYAEVIKQIRSYVGKPVKAFIFSDGSDEELKELLDLPDVERISFGTSIADIIALSRFPVFVASGSSFSMWARYLGRMSCICYTNQIKQKILTEKDTGFEYETDGKIIPEIGDRIREILK